MEEQEQAQVIQFKKRDDADPLVKRKPVDIYRGCRHGYYEIDTEARTVECSECHKVLDPIEVLLWFCSHYSERDYKWQKIQEFEAKEALRTEKQKAKWAAKAK